MALPEDILGEDLGSYDYIIVGAGSGGCILANRLSANPNYNVLLIEAGPKQKHIFFTMPAGFTQMFGTPRADWCFKTEPQPELNLREIAYARGRGLGGCTLINGLIYTRGHRLDYDHWRELGNTGWGWDEVLPFFKSFENAQDTSSTDYGRHGELRFEKQKMHWNFVEAIRAGCDHVGVPRLEDFNDGNTEGSSFYPMTACGGVRQHTARAFLEPIRSRKNLHILTEAQVSKLLLDGSRATGLVIQQQGKIKRATAHHEVILAAGAVHSPQILELSGIGQKQILDNIGIPTQHQLDHVGEHLQDHLTTKLVYKMDGANSLNQSARTLMGRAKMFAQWALFKSGPLNSGICHMGIFAKTQADLPMPDIQYFVMPYSAGNYAEGVHNYPGVTMSVCQLQPHSRGSIHATSASIDDAPEIQPNFLSAEEDQQTMVRAVKFTRDIMASVNDGFAPQEMDPGPQVADDESILAFVRQNAASVFHPSGTCRMAPEGQGVVDSRLRVQGIEGLRIADASIMPRLVSANTNAPTIMIAEKAAAMVLEDRR